MRTPAKNVLLTGAGFTKDFGGYLGKEMWSVLFTQKQIMVHPQLRQSLLKNFDFESVYQDVIDAEDLDEIIRKDFGAAIQSAYEQMQSSITTYCYAERDRIKGFLKYLIARFAGSDEEWGFFFTVNQDLFIETYYPNQEVSHLKGALWIPGVTPLRNAFTGLGCDLSHWVQLPDQRTIQRLDTDFWNQKSGHSFAYIKLHGSLGWKSANGSGAMVVGGRKPDRIREEPYLHWSFQLFQQVIEEGNRNLVVIGYGFKDDHINKLIHEGITRHDLKLFVVTPQQPDEFRKELPSMKPMKDIFSEPQKRSIWEGLHGYYLGTALDLFDAKKIEPSPIGRALLTSLGLP